MKTKITAIILTFNEELHIERAVCNAKKISDRVVVVDSFSTDRTAEISKAHGAEVFFNPFVNQALQFQWAIDNCNVSSEWILRLDADEYLEDDLVREVLENMDHLDAGINGLCFKRKHIFLGKWIKHGGRYPLVLLRLFRRGTAHIENKWMDEHIVLDSGKSLVCNNSFVDDNHNSVTWFIDKHNRYATREMFELMVNKYNLSKIGPSSFIDYKTSIQASVKRYLKLGFYNRLPYFIRPTMYFIYRYFFQFGFLDGREGFAYHFMQGYWYRALVDLKCHEY